MMCPAINFFGFFSDWVSLRILISRLVFSHKCGIFLVITYLNTFLVLSSFFSLPGILKKKNDKSSVTVLQGPEVLFEFIMSIFSLWVTLGHVCYHNLSPMTLSSILSILLLDPSTGCFIVVIFFNSKISIWFSLYFQFLYLDFLFFKICFKHVYNCS